MHQWANWRIVFMRGGIEMTDEKPPMPEMPPLPPMPPLTEPPKPQIKQPKSKK